MSDDESEQHELSEYELLRQERIKRNEAKLAKLGLLDFWNNQQQPKKKKKTTPRKKAPTPRPGEERRSKRLSGKPQQLLQLSSYHDDEVAVEQGGDADFDTDADEEVEPYEAEVSFRQVRRQIKLNREDYAVSAEDMQNLRGGVDVETFLTKFQEFLRFEVSARACVEPSPDPQPTTSASSNPHAFFSTCIIPDPTAAFNFSEQDFPQQ